MIGNYLSLLDGHALVIKWQNGIQWQQNCHWLMWVFWNRWICFLETE